MLVPRAFPLFVFSFLFKRDPEGPSCANTPTRRHDLRPHPCFQAMLEPPASRLMWPRSMASTGELHSKPSCGVSVQAQNDGAEPLPPACLSEIS